MTVEDLVRLLQHLHQAFGFLPESHYEILGNCEGSATLAASSSEAQQMVSCTVSFHIVSIYYISFWIPRACTVCTFGRPSAYFFLWGCCYDDRLGGSWALDTETNHMHCGAVSPHIEASPGVPESSVVPTAEEVSVGHCMRAVTEWAIQHCSMVWKAPVAASPLPATPVVLGLIQRRWTDVVSRCLSVSYLVFLHWRFIFSFMRSRIGTCCPITSPGLMCVLTTCYMRKHVSHCFIYVA